VSYKQVSTPTSKSMRVALIIVFVVLFLGMFSRTMNHSLYNDEHMYISAGVLAQNNAIYEDFAYLQMPYLPIVYAAIYRLTETSHYLLWGRMCSLALMVLASFLIFLIFYRLSGDLLLSTVFLLLFVLNRAVLHVLPLAWNQVMPLAFSILGFYLFITGLSEANAQVLRMFLVGFCVAIAVGAKLTYAPLALVFPLMCFFNPRSLRVRRRLLRMSLPVVAGLILGLLPALLILMKNGRDVFFFNNLGYHLANTAWREAQEYTSGMSLQAKIRYVWEMLGWPCNVCLLVALGFVLTNLATGLRKRSIRLAEPLRTETLLSATLALLTTLVALQPRPLFAHYFAAPVPFIIILICCFYAAIPTAKRGAARALLVCIVIVTSVFSGPRLLKHIHNVYNVDAWTPISVHNTAQIIRGRIGALDSKDKVATLSPLYVIEAGLPIYKELASGPFLYRVGDLIPDDMRPAYVGTSMNTLSALFEIDPPKAILVGFERGLDLPFIRYAEAHAYVKIEEDYAGLPIYKELATGPFLYRDRGTLYVRQDN